MKNANVWNGLKRRNRRWYLTCLVLTVLLIGLICLMMIYGKTVYSPKEIIAVLSGADLGNANYTIMKLRLPRMLTGISAGFAFGMAGNVFQTVLRNNLASPDIIGVSASTSAVAVFCISFLGISDITVSVAAVIIGLLISVAIVLLASKDGFSHARMILIGIGVQSMVHAFTSWILTRTSEYDISNTFRWMNGSLNSSQFRQSLELIVIVGLTSLLLACRNRNMRVLELGDEYAQTLGADPKWTYRLLLGAAVLLVAFATAVTGPISSVAFLAGPVATRMTGRSKSGILPSGLTGAVLVMAADMAGQYAFAQRFPVGVITGLLGAPYLIFLLVTINQKGEKME